MGPVHFGDEARKAGDVVRGVRAWVVALVALVACAAGARAARGDQAAIEALLEAMGRAVLAGDGAEYLRHVDRADGVFFKEQENWAADFKHAVPAAFTMSVALPEPPKEGEEEPTTRRGISAPIEPVWGEDEAKCTVALSWQIKNGSRERKVSYPARFVRREGRWLYAGEAWEVVERPPNAHTGFRGVRVKFLPGLDELAGRIADAAPEVRAYVDQFLGVTVEQVQEVKLYRSMIHLQESIYLSYTDPLGGWNEPGEAIKFLAGGANMGPTSLKSLFAHEYGHVATFAHGPRVTDAPWWLVEGIADLCAGRFRNNPAARRDGTVLSWAKRDQLGPWDEMSDFRTTDRRWAGQVYTQGEHMAAFISEQFGDEGRNRLLAELGREPDFRTAFQRALGVPFNLVDAQWRAVVYEQLRAQQLK